MPSLFRKSVLRVGTYKSPDGVVLVTPERLRHWEQEHQRLSRNGQVVPVAWDHAQEAENAVPMSAEAFTERRRSARDTVGRLKSIKAAPDGQSATIVLQIDDQAAARKAEQNSVFVSPVIFENWRDGRDRHYRDVITHVDFVNHPVDDSQGPFERCQPGYTACALRMGLSPVYKPEREAAVMSKLEMAIKPDDDELDDDELDEEGSDLDGDADADFGGGEGLDTDGDGRSDALAAGDDGGLDDLGGDLDGAGLGDDGLDGLDDSGSMDDTLGDGLDDGLDSMGDADLMTDAEPPGLTEQVMADLQAAGIAPPEGVDAESDPAGFLRQLCAALRQKRISEQTAGNGFGGDDDDMGADAMSQTASDPNAGVNVTSPEYAALSLRNNAVTAAILAERQNSVRLSLGERIRKAFRLGQIDRQTAIDLKKKAGKVRMSLGKDGRFDKSDVEKKVEWHERLPRGTFWPSSQRLGLGGAQAIEPDPMYTAGAVSKAEAKKHVDALAAQFPGMFKPGK